MRTTTVMTAAATVVAGLVLAGCGSSSPSADEDVSRPAAAAPTPVSDPTPSSSASPAVTRGETGVVKWFNREKGYGFIMRSNGQQLFVHYSAIEMEGYRTLEVGDQVEFNVTQGPKGDQAENVILVKRQAWD